jgi:hypothetical protein
MRGVLSHTEQDDDECTSPMEHITVSLIIVLMICLCIVLCSPKKKTPKVLSQYSQTDLESSIFVVVDPSGAVSLAGPS